MEINTNNSIEKDELTGDVLISGHEYDNIKELDNKLPRWWVWLFIITIVYAVVYVILFDVTKIAPHQEKEYQDELAAVSTNLQQNIQPNAVDTASLVVLTDEQSLTEGKAIWTKNCIVCHLAEGQGLVGPNLTDNYSIHGCGYKDIYNIITVGVPAKGMISWSTQLSPKQIAEVSSFVMTLKGTNPQNAKAPQGDQCK